MSKKRIHNNPPLSCLGWREWVSLPQLHVKQIKAKVDTGARTSALHAFDIKFFKVENIQKVSFTILPVQHSKRHRVRVSHDLIDQRTVKSSLGHKTLRPVIRTPLVMGDKRCPIEITLVNRDIMGFRMLLGRQALKNRWFVNPGRSFLMGGNPK